MGVFMRLHRLLDLCDIGAEGLDVSHRDHRGDIASAHAGRADHAHILAERTVQVRKQLLCTGHGAGQ